MPRSPARHRPAIGFATRAALQQALDERSNGRLQLDPDSTS